jgi:hypothetical protein
MYLESNDPFELILLCFISQLNMSLLTHHMPYGKAILIILIVWALIYTIYKGRKR